MGTLSTGGILDVFYQVLRLTEVDPLLCSELQA